MERTKMENKWSSEAGAESKVTFFWPRIVLADHCGSNLAGKTSACDLVIESWAKGSMFDSRSMPLHFSRNFIPPRAKLVFSSPAYVSITPELDNV